MNTSKKCPLKKQKRYSKAGIGKVENCAKNSQENHFIFC
jgi:hypothetical protein